MKRLRRILCAHHCVTVAGGSARCDACGRRV